MWETVGIMAADSVLNAGQSLFNNHMAERSADKAYQRQLSFWNRQNEYNSPRAQRDRFNQAGMNPSAVMGEVASGQTAQQLSSVPQNEFAQNGMLKLRGLADTLEVLARIEKMGAETGLATEQMTSEALRQTLLGLGIPEAKAKALIAEYESQAKGLEIQYLPRFLEHQSTMYDLDEQLAQAKFEHEQALTNLTNAQTETEKEEAKKVVAETGLIELKSETEKSIAYLNYTYAEESQSRKKQIDWETKKSVVLAPIQRRAMEIANQVQATEEQRLQIENEMKQLDLKAKSNDEGDANLWYYIDESINAIGTILGVAVGTAIGGKSKAVKSVGKGSGLYVPGSTNIGGENFVRL